MTTMRVEQGLPVPGKLVYRDAEYAFDTEPRPETCGASFTVNELELMLDDEDNKRVVFVAGYAPYAEWRVASLLPPAARLGLLRGETGTPFPAGYAMAISEGGRWPVVVDSRNGWIRVGHGMPRGDNEGIEFAPGAIAILDGNRLVALWLHPERLPESALQATGGEAEGLDALPAEASHE